jgi:hypothetical protein
MPIQVEGLVIEHLDFVHAAITVEASITATSSATGDTCISTGVFGLDHAGDYYVEVFTPYITKGTTNIDVELFEGATAAAGTFLQTLTGHMTASTTIGFCPNMRVLLALTKGAHQLTVTAFVDGGTGKFGAGAGTTGTPPPARIRVRSA